MILLTAFEELTRQIDTAVIAADVILSIVVLKRLIDKVLAQIMARSHQNKLFWEQ